MSMKTNDLLGMTIGAFALVFLLFIIQGIFVSVGKGVKSLNLGNFKLGGINMADSAQYNPVNGSGASGGATTPTAPVSVPEVACSAAVTSGYLVKSGSVADISLPTDFGAIEGMVYTPLLCRNGRVTTATTANVVVGIFPALSSRDLVNKRYVGSAPIATTLCSGNQNPCYRFVGVNPGNYSVLVDSGNGWFCDRGTCRVTVGGGFRQIFDVAL